MRVKALIKLASRRFFDLAGGSNIKGLAGSFKDFLRRSGAFSWKNLGAIWIFARERRPYLQPTHVLPGLVPGIHAWKPARA
jgi:hypothetical protein